MESNKHLPRRCALASFLLPSNRWTVGSGIFYAPSWGAHWTRLDVQHRADGAAQLRRSHSKLFDPRFRRRQSIVIIQ